MSLFSSIGKAIEKIVIVPTANVIGSGLKAVGIPYQKQTTAAFDNTVGKIYTSALGLSATAAAIGGAASIPAASYAAGAKTVAAAAIKSPIKATAVAASSIVGANVLISSPKARSAVASAPSSLANVGKNVGQFVENPTAANAKTIFSENPVATSILGAAGIIGVGAGVSGLVASAVNTSAVKENTKATLENPNVTKAPEPQEIIIKQEGATIPQAPIQTAIPSEISQPKASKTKKKKAKKKKTKKKAKKKAKKKTKSKKKNIKRKKSKK